VAKKTLYQALQVSPTAEPEVIKAAYDAKLAALQQSAAPEVAAERTIVREAYELLADPVRRKLYDEKLREERFRALSSGGEDMGRPRPANSAAAHPAESPASSPLGWMSGVALLAVVAIIGAWVWLDHKHKAEAQRLEELRQAEELRLKNEQAQFTREAVDWAKDRTDAARQTAEERRQDMQRQADNRRIEYERQRLAQQEQADQRKQIADQQRAAAEQRRQDQDSLRQSQQQLERDRRYLQELERNRGMAIPPR
jgi:curved DNA-binding protein CbpA